MVVGDGISQALEKYRLTSLRLRYDKSSLTLSDRGEHIHDSARWVCSVAVSQKVELLVREEWSQEVERYAVPDVLRTAAVNHLDVYEREVFVTFARRTNLSEHCVSIFQSEAFNLLGRYIDVVRTVKVVVVRAAKESVSVRHNLQHAGSGNRAFVFREWDFFRLRLLCRLLCRCILLLLNILLCIDPVLLGGQSFRCLIQDRLLAKVCLLLLCALVLNGLFSIRFLLTLFDLLFRSAALFLVSGIRVGACLFDRLLSARFLFRLFSRFYVCFFCWLLRWLFCGFLRRPFCWFFRIFRCLFFRRILSRFLRWLGLLRRLLCSLRFAASLLRGLLLAFIYESSLRNSLCFSVENHKSQVFVIRFL